MKTIFTDKDGVLNGLCLRNNDIGAPTCKEELHYFPGIKEAIELAHYNGFAVMVVSNQADCSDEFLEYQEHVLMNDYGINGIMFARHRGNKFYKPNPGMIEEFVNIYNIPVSESWMIGDTWKDCISASLGRVRYVHVGPEDSLGPTWSYATNFPDAVEIIVNQDKMERNFRGKNNPAFC